MDRLTLESLRAFLVFADTLNFTHAAERLCLSQPALHVKIQELSRGLGLPLYMRRGRRLELTSKGEELARFAREMDDRVAGFVADFQDRGGQRPVVLAAGEGAYLYLLGPALRTYLQSSQVPLQLLTSRGDETLEAVRSGKAHLGVGSFSELPIELSAHPLCQIQQVLVFARGHRLARRKHLRLSDLEGLRLIVPPPGRPQRQMLSDRLSQAGVKWSVAVEASGWELMLHFVQLGLGAAVVNSFCAIPPGCLARPIEDLHSISYSVVLSSGYHRPEANQLLKEILQAGREFHKANL
ncbi:LysR family transcriptional regulator [bacterium]|nr:LysR family transcriptional regulator [bacterium]